MPWDVKPLMGLAKFKAGLVGLFFFLFLPVAVVGGICITVILIRDRSSLSFWQFMGLSVTFILTILLSFLFYSAYNIVHNKLQWSLLEKHPSESISLLHMELGRSLYDECSPEFLGDGMRVTGRLTFDHLTGFLIAISVIALTFIFTYLVWLIFRLPIVAEIGAGAAGFLVLVLAIQEIFLKRDEETSILVKHDNIHTLRCEGPIVNIRFVTPPVRRLRVIQLFIPRALRKSFFWQLDKAFPELLPPAYRNAM